LKSLPKHCIPTLSFHYSISFAIVLQLPDEEYLVKQHTYEKKSEDHFRYLIYRKRIPEEHGASGFG
jgi:hypothetical protein